MKMFRRIFALTMVIAMVCLFSASAFAAASYVYDYQDSYSFGDPDGSGVTVLADIDRLSTTGWVEMGTLEGQENYMHIEVSCGFYLGSMSYYCTDEYAEDYSQISYAVLHYDRDTKGYNIYEMDVATYDFYVEYSPTYGFYSHSFNSGRLTY